MRISLAVCLLRSDTYTTYSPKLSSLLYTLQALLRVSISAAVILETSSREAFETV